MPQIIRNVGDPKNTITLNGKRVERRSEIYVPSHQANIPVLPQSIHFCYRDASRPRGSTLFCTCGSSAIIVGYEAYRNLSSYIANEVIACHNLIMYNRHSDGSHE